MSDFADVSSVPSAVSYSASSLSGRTFVSPSAAVSSFGTRSGDSFAFAAPRAKMHIASAAMTASAVGMCFFTAAASLLYLSVRRRQAGKVPENYSKLPDSYISAVSATTGAVSQRRIRSPMEQT